MKNKKLSGKKLRKGVLCGILLVILILCVKKYREILIYDNLSVNISDKVFEYGNAINLNKFFDKKNKDYKYSIVKDLNTSKVGKQQVEVKVEYKGVARIVPLSVSVVDTVAPTIQIKEETITIDEGDELSLVDNVGDVLDNEEKLEYKEQANITEGDTGYYTIYKNNFDNNTPGEYAIGVIAIDKAGNKTESGFKVVVKEVIIVPVVVETPVYHSDVVSNAASNLQGGDIVSIAYSFVGYPYVYGGASPSGFDCAGFVQYVYSQVGKSISRTSNTQALDGVGISYSEAQPGDILSWGHGGYVTHSALYIGNGQMIHAMNSNSGVIISNVDSWTNEDVLMSVRRIA